MIQYNFPIPNGIDKATLEKFLNKQLIKVNYNLALFYLDLELKDKPVQRYEIFHNGISGTQGSDSEPYTFGTIKARSFDEACLKFFRKYPDPCHSFDTPTVYWGVQLHCRIREKY